MSDIVARTKRPVGKQHIRPQVLEQSLVSLERHIERYMCLRLQACLSFFALYARRLACVASWMRKLHRDYTRQIAGSSPDT